MTRPRVVITGIGGVTPLANDIESTWKKLLAGESGIAPITLFDASAYDSRIAGEVKNFVAEDYMPMKQARRMDRFTQFAVASAKMLLEDSKYEITDANAYDTGVILGIGLGGLHTIETYHAKLLESGPHKISPFMIPMLISNMGPGQISIFTGAKGSNIVTTTACASAIHALGTAYSEMVLGRATAVISGGVEATVTPLGVAGFTALKALSTQFNDEPARASHMTAPRDDGEGMARAMQNALREAGIDASAIGHINAHATSTMLNDSTETKAIKTVFGAHAKKVKISATKSMTGHLLGAAGGIESVFTALALHDEMLPGTINLENPDPACDLDYMADGSKHIACEYAMCNSFGFGGTNASVIFKKWQQ